MQLRLNPAIDLNHGAAAFEKTGMVQIPDIFEPDLANEISTMLEKSLPWGLAFQGVNGPQAYNRQQLRAADQQQIRSDLKAMLERTGQGYGFMYLSYPMITAYLQQWDPGHPIHQLTEFLNSPEFVQIGARLTGRSDVIKADAQATLYRPGDFIGLHNDIGSEASDRVAAYTLGFTRKWRSDWGGQLLFHDAGGDVGSGFAPRWNTLTVFKVPRLHSVAPVAAYAQDPRISIVGWFRNRG
jgi:SM-20-related protein